MGVASQNRTPDTQIFRDVFNASPIGIAVENLEGQPLFVNPAFCSMLGFSEEELRGKHCVEFSPPEDAEKDWALFQQLRAGAIDHYLLEKRYFRRDGSLVWGRLSISLLNSRPSPLVVAMVEEITDKKTAEEAVRASEERLRLAQQIAHVGSFEWNIQTGVNTWTPELEAMYGLLPGTFTGTQTAFENLVHPDDRAGVIKLADAAMKSGQPTQGEWRVVWADGSVHWIAGRWQVFMDASGEPSKMIGVNIDVTERKLADEARLEVNRTLEAQAALLQSREELLKIFVKNVPAAVAMLDREMRYLQVSNRWCTDYLRGRTQILGRSHYEIFPDMPERWKEVHRRGLRGETLRADEDRWDGQNGPHWARWEVRPWKTPEGTVGGILILAEDITRRKQIEEALRESEDKLRLLLDSTAEAIYGIDLEHRCTFCNPACLRTLGYKRMDEVLGKNIHDLIHHTRADGTPFPAEDCRVHRVTRTGEGVHTEDEVFWRANGTSFPAEYWSYPQRRGHEVVGAVVAFIDITERKLAEGALANVSRRLIEAQEQERTRIGRELHDDIGQRLALLAVELQQLNRDPLILPKVRRRMGKIQKQTVEIAADIQSLSHELHSAKLQYLGIAAAMRGFCREFGEQQKVEIDFQTGDLPTPLSADISLCLFRVLQEALHNSAKHSGVRHFEVLLRGTSDEIHLTVKDSGKGFDREAAKTSQGLGLISMEERLKLVKGTLLIEAQPKHGTTIHARVPLSSGGDSMLAAG
jgi:PAS domain S-box-containing protein